MHILRPSADRRLNLLTGLLFLIGACALAASLISHSPEDPAWNTAAEALRPRNWVGYPGAWFSDIVLSLAGFASWLLPLMVFGFGLRRMRSQSVEAPGLRVFGAALLILSVCTLLSLAPDWKPLHETMPPGGVIGLALSAYLLGNLNLGGTLALVSAAILISLYLTTSFTVETVEGWIAVPMAWWDARVEGYQNWLDRRRARSEQNRLLKNARKQQAPSPEPPDDNRSRKSRRETPTAEPQEAATATADDSPPWETGSHTAAAVAEWAEEPEANQPPPGFIPIVPLDHTPHPDAPNPAPAPAAPLPTAATARRSRRQDSYFTLPSTKLLSEPPARNQYDEQELHETAARIKVKFEEFNVFGSVVQINPGPVVTTFEFKPEAGIKVSRITQLSEDLCLGLQAESVLIERIPGKSTVGIEVPNRRREVISLRQILESDEFRDSTSKLTIPLGKDINGRIKVASLETMPHVLIAGSTGSGKSVMLNTLITSVLYKATPEDVRMIMVDPKRVELGVYEGIPHLLTPVITDPKKATYALRNAVLEMERRLKLLASQGVRNIDQYNRKVRDILSKPRDLFADETEDSAQLDELRPLPYILIIIDELADLMMLERAGVEESITRLAQMARAVGMHLVLATQRPSVDVITGLIKANFPTRISFRVATRVDSRTILDDMGAQHLLGKGDMLYRPPGTSRLTRVHGAYVSEDETAAVVDNWKAQAEPDYDQSFLLAPPNEEGDDDDAGDEAISGEEDPRYQDAVRAVCELGKASTSVLQRRLRLGYGRAARILDMMYRDGIIGPPDGSRPREVLKRPDWLDEVDEENR